MKRYHAHNGRYTNNGFMVSLNAKNQTITFYGIGTHHQNSIVERRISTVTKKARRIILHTHANGLNVSTQCFGHLMLRRPFRD